MAAEYPGITRDELRRLPQLMLCTLLGAITPDHVIKRLPGKDVARLTRTDHDLSVLLRVHKPHSAYLKALAATRGIRQ